MDKINAGTVPLTILR